MTRKLIISFAIIVVALLTTTVAAIAQEPGVSGDESGINVVPKDGQWQGTTSQGFNVEFIVRDSGTTVAWIFHEITYACFSGAEQTWNFRWGGFSGVPVTEDKFVFLHNINPEGAIEPGATFFAVIGGLFTSDSTTQGILRAGKPEYTGTRLRAVSCFNGNISWTAEWIGPAPESPSDDSLMIQGLISPAVN